MGKYYSYYRVSTLSQVEANGISMQVDVVGKYVKEHDIEISGIFKDEGISGTVIDRPGLTEMLAVLEKGDKVIVQNTSRLWRSDGATYIIKRELTRIGADIISVEQPRYTIYEKNPNEFFMNKIFEALDQYDKMLISIKLAKGRKAKASKGKKPCGAVPYGYKWDNRDVVIDYNNHLVVIDIFEKYIELRSLEKLRNYCIEKGYKTSLGKDFSKQSLKIIIENEFYIGKLTYADKQVDGEHELFLDKELFEKANAILKR